MGLKLIWLSILAAASAFSASVDQYAFDSCGPSEFSCGDGDCVNEKLVCDGARDCAYGEDELNCVRRLINLSSDSDPVPRRSRRQTSTLSRLQNGTCTLPEYPAHGKYITNNMPDAKPGEAYDQVNISISCYKGFVADNSTSITCFNGHWQNKMPKCVSCGTVTSSARPLIAGAASAKLAEVPWHAGIYSKDTKPYRQICAGSLISTDIVISAAHCFWKNKLGGGAKLPAASFAVAVGKLYRPWNDNKDEAQKSDVKEIHLPTHYQGSEAQFQHDIAVLIVTKAFEYKTFIRPVCIDFDTRFEGKQLQPGKKGMVAGWGLTAENGTASQVLKVIDLPYISVNTCISETPLQFRGYITGDKICAGFKDEGKAVCEGDSGGGLAFPESDTDATRFYLRGIVSSSPRSVNLASLCNVNEYTTFTRIQSHENFINTFWVTAGIRNDGDGTDMLQQESCTLPPYPDRGTYVVTNDPNARPGDSLPIAVINVSCDAGYKINGSNSGYCLNGTWQEQFPECVGLPCKEESISTLGHSYTPRYSLDDVSLDRFVTMKRNCSGHRTYFEIHFAVQTDGHVEISLSDEKKFASSNIKCILSVGQGSRPHTSLFYNRSTVQDIGTPDILSSTQFRTLYIKIDNGKLQFGKEGDTPLISYSDAGIRSLNYYSFDVHYSKSAKLRYCPASVEGLPCKEGSLSTKNLGYTPNYSMDDVFLNHYGMLKRNSTGHLTYFELHVAVQTDGVVPLYLSEKKYYTNSNIRYQLKVGEDSNQRTKLYYNGALLQDIDTPDILSTTQLRTFYIKMDDGKLQFGKEGGPPLISYSDAGFGSLNYYSFDVYYSESAKISYCPAGVEGTS